MFWRQIIKSAEFAVAVALVALAGCEKSSDAVLPTRATKVAAKKPSRAKPPQTFFDTLAATSVVVRVDGVQCITKADVLAWWNARVKMFAVGRGRSMSDRSDEVRQFRRSVRDRSLAELVRNAMIASYAARKGITPDPARERAAEQRIMRELRKPKGSWGAFAKSLGAEAGAMFVKMIHADALSEAVISTLTTNDIYHITNDEYTNQVAFIKKWNERTDASNKVVKARAVAARQEILGGAMFADVAKKCADFCPEQGSKWKLVQLDEFDGGDPLGTWLAGHDVGDISEPIDLEDGVSIVGIRMKDPSERGPDGKMTLETYELVRCAFYAYERFEDHDGDKKAIVEDMLEARRKDLMLELRAKLEKECKIEFPNGKDLFRPLKASANAKKKKDRSGKQKPVKGKASPKQGTRQ